VPEQTGIFNRCRRIILHILSHFAYNRKNRKVFVFVQCKSGGGGVCIIMRQNLNSITWIVWRAAEKIYPIQLTNVTLLTFVLINASTFLVLVKGRFVKLVNTRNHMKFLSQNKIVELNAGYQIWNNDRSAISFEHLVRDIYEPSQNND